MWETNKITHFVSSLVSVHDLVRGEESQESKKRKREGRRKKRGSKIRYAFVLESSVWNF